MNNDLKSVDGLVTDILGTTNFIAKFLFNKNSVLIAAVVSLFIFVLVWVS